MDAILPFLPRIAYIIPSERRSLYVAGIKDAKIKKINKELKRLEEHKLNAENQEVSSEEESETGTHLDIWV